MSEFVKFFGAVVFYFIIIRGCNGECDAEENEVKYELVKSGTSFFENCCSLNKNATLRWLDSQKQEVPIGLGTDSNVYTERNENDIILYIKRLKRGIYDYTCFAEIDGKSFTQEQIIIEFYDPPFIFNTNQYQNVIKGSDGVVSCSVGPINDTNINTEWLREKYDEKQIVESDKYNINGEIGLKIKNVDDEDGGIYKCRASHYKSGDIVEQEIQVEVITLPTISNLKVTPENFINEGDTLTIECIAEGQPHPVYSWKKIPKQEENTTRWTQHINIITINNVDRNDEGIYECIVNNTGGSAKSTVSIEVQYAPNIISFENITVLEGSSFAQLECKAKGRPIPDIVIMADIDIEKYPSLPLVSFNFTETEAKRTVTFTNVSRFHDGLYYCNANNSIDSVTTVSKLTVLHKPYIIGNTKETLWGWNEKTLNLTCKHESNPLGSVIWNFKGNNSVDDDEQLIVGVMKNISVDSNYATFTIHNEAYYGIYECTVVNKFGEDVKTIHLKRALLPGPIRNTKVVQIKPTSVIFNITGPEESKITGYTAQYDEKRNYEITNIHLNRTWSVDWPYRIDKLKPGTTYNVRFAAKNELGDGNWSDFISFSTLESMAPDAPSWNLESKESAALRDISESATIALKWNEPENNGEPIEYYIIRYCAANDNITETDEDVNCKVQKLTNNEITIENLIPNATYRIDVLAHNSIGNSSAISTFITTLAFISDQPTSLLSAGAIIAVSVITVLFCLLILDIILFVWQKKGIIASCFQKKKKKEHNFNFRDNKGLLKHSLETDDTLKRPANRTNQPEYKNSGVITGRHSAV